MDPVELMTPRILVVDDERQIFAALRLRLTPRFELSYCACGKTAVELIGRERFDLCFVDLNMPRMDGFEVIEAARKVDPMLGYVVISAHDTTANLKRAIPLQVFDFVSKPLPQRSEFDHRIPEWVSRTRKARHARDLTQHAAALEADRDTARLEREIELLASDTARDALLDTATRLTSVHAHLLTATTLLSARTKSDPAFTQLLRNLEEARRSADAARSVAERFFGSAYAARDTGPALVNECIQAAVKLAVRDGNAASSNVIVDFETLTHSLALTGISGMKCIAMLFPLFTSAIRLSPRHSTIRVRCEVFPRLDGVPRHPVMRTFLWLNRQGAATSQSGVVIEMTLDRPSMSRPDLESWLKGTHGESAGLPAEALFTGLKAIRGLWGFSLAPTPRFRLALALPV